MFHAGDKYLKKNYAKKDVFRHFLETLEQKIAFFRRALSPQN